MVFHWARIIACSLSFLLAVATAALSAGVCRVPLRLGYSTPDARCTLRFDRAALRLMGPPPRGPRDQEEKAWKFIRERPSQNLESFGLHQDENRKLSLVHCVIPPDADIFWSCGPHGFKTLLTSQSPSQIASP